MSKINLNMKFEIVGGVSKDSYDNYRIKIRPRDLTNSFTISDISEGDKMVFDTTNLSNGDLSLTSFTIQSVVEIQYNFYLICDISYDEENNNSFTIPDNFSGVLSVGVISRPTQGFDLLSTISPDNQELADFWAENVSNVNLERLDSKLTGILGLDSNGDYVPQGSSSSTSISDDIQEIFQTLSDNSGNSNVSVSETAPENPSEGDLWWDSETGTLKVYYTSGYTDTAGDDAWVEISSSGSLTSSNLSNISDNAQGVVVTGKVAADSLDIGFDGSITAQGGTKDFRYGIVNFSGADVAGLGDTIDDQVDFHLNKDSSVVSDQVLSWNGTDYEWVDNQSDSTETSTLDDVVTRGNSTTGDIITTGKVYFSNVFATEADLFAVNASTYHGMFAHVHATGAGYFAHLGSWVKLANQGGIDSLQSQIDTLELSGSSVTIQDNAPSNPSSGDLWWNSNDGVLRIFYVEPNENPDSYWVATSSTVTNGTQDMSSITDGTSTVSFDSANEVVMDTDLNVNAINLSGHIIPTQNAQFDLGNAEYKIRHLFLSDNSLWIGDDVKVGIDENGIPEFKKVKRASGHVPKVILEKAKEAGLGSSVEEVAAHALGWFNAEVGIGGTPNLEPDAADLSDERITLKLWYSYAITNIPGFDVTFPDIPSIFPPKDGGGDLYDDGDYEEITKIGKSNKHVPLTEVNTRTDSFILAASDHGTYIRIISGGDVVVSLPDDATDIPIGTTVVIGRNGDGNVVFAPLGGAIIQTPYSLQIALKFGKVTVMKTAPNTWEVEGNLLQN